MKRTLDDTESSDTLVQHSLQQYREMFELLCTLSRCLDRHDTGKIEQVNAAFGALHSEAQVIDQKLMDRLQKSSIPASINAYLCKRRDLQEDILQLLKETLPKANSVKSLLASEMLSIKNGRRAMSGYKNYNVCQGRIVNKRS
ncbi:MAG: hypothetical protein ACWGOX_06640 [Desulforhopalus sp.]